MWVGRVGGSKTATEKGGAEHDGSRLLRVL